jgi:galactonate dehydratase
VPIEAPGAGVRRVARVASHILNVSPKTNWVFVSVQDDSGRTAWGEASINGWETLLVAACERQRADIEGQALQVALQQLRPPAQSPGGLAANAIGSALQQALVALQAAERGVPVHAVLGSLRRAQVPVYANINRATTERTPTGFVATAKRARAEGYQRFKAAPFDGLTPALCATPEGQRRIRHGVDCMLALRDALGPDAWLMVDCHWRFDEPRALEALRALAPARLHWFECPLAETHAYWPAMRRIRAAAKEQGVLLAAAETQVGLAAFQTIFDESLYDVVMPDVKYCGGPLEMVRIAQAAALHGVGFSPHNPTGPVCSWFSLQVAGVVPECAMLEIQYDESPLFMQLTGAAHPAVTGGMLVVPDTPAEGPQVDEAALRAHPYRAVPAGIESLLFG